MRIIQRNIYVGKWVHQKLKTINYIFLGSNKSWCIVALFELSRIVIIAQAFTLAYFLYCVQNYCWSILYPSFKALNIYFPDILGPNSINITSNISVFLWNNVQCGICVFPFAQKHIAVIFLQRQDASIRVDIS